MTKNTRLSEEDTEMRTSSRLTRIVRECVAFPFVFVLTAGLIPFFLLFFMCSSLNSIVRRISGTCPLKVSVSFGK